MPRTRRRDPDRERFWRDAVAGWKKSGQTVRAYCDERGLSQPSFYAWRRELVERDRTTIRQPAKFVPMQIVVESMVEVVLPSGVVVRVPPATEATAVARLVAALEAAPC
jgi:hypothetical protein